MKPGLLVKLLGLTVIAGALFACMTISASAVDLNQLTYATNDDGTMAITGCDKEAEGELVIPETIGGRTVTFVDGFYDCQHITKVTLPSTIKTIDDYAFDSCAALTEINIPNGVTVLGESAFGDCPSLKTIRLPDSVQSIGSKCFMNCTGLSAVKLPEGIDTISWHLFDGCTSLTGIAIPSGVTSIDAEAFHDSGLKSVVIPSGVKSIGNSAFAGCTALDSVTLNEGLDYIDREAFRDCTSLKSIVIPDSVTYMSDGVCAGCSCLETAVIGKRVETLWTYAGAFRDCTSLRTVYLYPGLTKITNQVFANCPALADVYYCGTQAQWLATKIEEENDALLLADVHYMDSFNDVATASWYGPAVLWAVGQNVTNGVGNSAFAPGMTCTNAQVITFLYRAAGSPAVTGTSALNNVKNPDVYYYSPCVWAYQKGIITDTNFLPDGPATRASYVTYLWRYKGKPAVSGVTNPFTDVKSGDETYTAILWAYQNGITTGTSATEFSPNTICSRGQIVTFLYRYFA